MVVDATVPSLVLLAVVLAAVVGTRLLTALGEGLARHARAARTRPTVVSPSSRCPRVVLLDDDRWTPAAA